MPVTQYSYDNRLTCTALQIDRRRLSHSRLRSGSAPRPQTRYTYAQQTASYIQTSGGSPTPAPTPVTRPTQTSACATSSWSSGACGAGAGDETRATITYGTSNLLPTIMSAGSGSGGLTATTTSAYDMIGNLISVDGPLSGTDDVTRFRYDAARQQIGIVGPDHSAAFQTFLPASRRDHAVHLQDADKITHHFDARRAFGTSAPSVRGLTY